jgi:hypothetical protein
MGRINTGGAKKRSGDNIAIDSTVSGTTLKLTPPKGYYDGSTGLVTITDGDFIANNIRENINLFGKVGSAKILELLDGSNQWMYREDIKNDSTGDYVVASTFTARIAGTIRVTFQQRKTGSQYAVSRVTKNGIIQGDVNTCDSLSYITYQRVITVSPNDVINIEHSGNLVGSQIGPRSVSVALQFPFTLMT